VKKGKIYLVLVIILAVAFFGCSSDNSSEDASDVTVKYQVTGPAGIAYRINYTNPSGNLDTITDVALPWEKTLSLPAKLRYAGFSVSILSNTETYTAKVFANGKEIGSSTFSGYANVGGGF